MRRLHLIEIHDQAWCPRALRDAVTDQLRLLNHATRAYAPLVPRLQRALGRAPRRHIVDLCAGGGGPWPYLRSALGDAADGVTLTDYFPNIDAFRASVARAGGTVTFEPMSVDATDVPPHLRGFRTVFAAFHHFRPADARAILASAVRAREGIAIVEMTQRRASTIAMILAATWFAPYALTPFARPFRASRFALTYLVPLTPLVLTVDGIVSCLRSYDLEELEAMVESLDADDYEWEVGTLRRFGILPITFLIGVPRDTEGRA